MQLPPHQRMPITWDEKFVFGIFAVFNGIGMTGLLSTALAYLVTPTAAAGLGVALGVASIPIIAGAGVLSLLITVPLTYMGYKSFIHEAERLQADILAGEHARKKNQDKLFFEMLRLRALYENAEDFESAIIVEEGNDEKEVNQRELLALVNQIYEQYQNTRYAIEWKSSEKNPVIVKEGNNDHGRHFTKLLKDFHIATNDYFRNEILDYIKNGYHATPGRNEPNNEMKTELDASLSRCFRPVVVPKKIKRFDSILYGVMAGASVASTALGTGWTFAGLIIGSGLAASIPVAGWIILGIAFIGIGVAVGLMVGLSKQKNVAREVLNEQIEQSNVRLKNEKKTITNACFRQRVVLKTVKSENGETLCDDKAALDTDKVATVEVKKTEQAGHQQGVYAALHNLSLMSKPVLTSGWIAPKKTDGCQEDLSSGKLAALD